MAEIRVNNVTGPLFDIASGVAAASVGDTIIIENTGTNYSGVNNRNITLNFIGTSWDSPGIIIEGEESAGTYPVILNDESALSLAVVSTGSCDYVTIRQLTFISAQHWRPCGIRLGTATKHVLVELCEWPNLGGTGWYGRFAIQVAYGGNAANMDAEIRCCLFNPNPYILFQRGIRAENNAARVWVRHCLFWTIYYGIEHQPNFAVSENWDIENCDFYNVEACGVAITGIAAAGRLHVKDNIFYGQTLVGAAAFWLQNPPIGDVVSDYNDYYNNTNDRGNIAAGANDIAVDPAFTLGAMALWVGAIYGSTSLLPTATEVLSGAQDGYCQGGWLPATERLPCVEAEPGIYDCSYDKFYDEYPPDWESELSRKTGAQHVTIVCYDPGGRNIQLTTMVETIRPLQSEMSITFEEYQTKDVDIVFNDPDGWLDPFNPDALLYDDGWKDKPVEIGSWMVGTKAVLVHATMYLRYVKHDGHRTTWKCYDKYQKMLKRHMRANIVLEGDIESGGDTKLLQVDVNDLTVCPIGDWTLRFRNDRDFILFSQLAGEDGEGSRLINFTSESKAIYIDTTYWDTIAGDPVAGDEFRFISSLVLERTPALEGLETALTQHYDLTADDLDTAAWDAAKLGAQVWIIDIVQKDPITALEFVKKAMLHVAGALLIGSNGKLKPWRFVPTLQETGDVYAICSTEDLKKCQIESIENIDVVIAHYDKNVDGELMLTKRLPAVIAMQGIPPMAYYEEQNKEIWEFDLEGFDVVDDVLIDWLLRYYYELRVLPHSRFRIETMLENLRIQVGDVVWLQSSDPPYDACCLVYKVTKALAQRNIIVEIIEAENWLATCRTFACGYAICDVHYCDDCWVCW